MDQIISWFEISVVSCISVDPTQMTTFYFPHKMRMAAYLWWLHFFIVTDNRDDPYEAQVLFVFIHIFKEN